jgi:RNA-directed DNA polymerase
MSQGSADPMLIIVTTVVAATLLLGLLTLVAAINQRRSRKPLRHTPHSFATALPPSEGRYNLDELFRRLGMPQQDPTTAQPRYREVRIPKRRGGIRKLHVPDEPTKVIQRRILRRLLQRLNCHEAAMGFEKGKSIRDHAQRHVQSQVVVNLDLVDFFPSTYHQRVNAFFQRVGWNREAARWLTTWTCHDQGLPQGAPTSPKLSNLVNRLMDQQLSQCAARRGFRYSRYADDLTFSFPQKSEFKPPNSEEIHRLTREIKTIVRGFGYRLHRKKRRIRRQHQQQTVTGLVVNQKVQLPRQTRRWLRAVVHRHRSGKEATLSTQQLIGWNAFQHMLNHHDLPYPQASESASQKNESNLAAEEMELSGSQFSDAIELIQRATYQSSERDVLIQGLIGLSVTITGEVQENLPTLSSVTRGTIYDGGRTMILRLDGHGSLVEVLFAKHDSRSVSRWMYGERQTLQGTVARWNDRFERPQVECPSLITLHSPSS